MKRTKCWMKVKGCIGNKLHADVRISESKQAFKEKVDFFRDDLV